MLHRLYVRDKRKLKTQIKQNTTKPVWDEEFQLLVHEPEHQHLSLQMFDHDVLSVDDEIGRASFPIRNLRNGEEQEVDVEVKEEVGEKVDQMMVSAASAPPGTGCYLLSCITCLCLLFAGCSVFSCVILNPAQSLPKLQGCSAYPWDALLPPPLPPLPHPNWW